MKWNAFNSISSSIDKTKERLFPFNFKEWFKLAIISLLSGGSGGGGPNSNGVDGGSKDITSESVEGIKEAFRTYWVPGAIIVSVILVLGLLLSYVKSVFTFIFVESLINHKSAFTFRKNNSKGISLFFFNFFISLIVLLVIGGLAAPMIYGFIIGNTFNFVYLIFSILFLLIFFLIIWFWLLFLYDFVVPYMYSKNVPTLHGLKMIWRDVRKNKLGTFVYWIARFVMGFVVGIISIIAFLLILLIFGLVFGLVGFLGFLLYKLVGGAVVFIILAVILGILVLILFILTLAIILLPLTVFFRYFQLINFEKLTNIKLLKF